MEVEDFEERGNGSQVGNEGNDQGNLEGNCL